MRMKEIVGLLAPLKYSAFVLLVLFLASLILVPAWKSFVFLVAFFVFLILPGYCVLLCCRMSELERSVMAIPVSAAIVNLPAYLLNVLGLKFYPWVVVVIALFWCFAGIYARRNIFIMD